jgi:hypothetical protein
VVLPLGKAKKVMIVWRCVLKTEGWSIVTFISPFTRIGSIRKSGGWAFAPARNNKNEKIETIVDCNEKYLSQVSEDPGYDSGTYNYESKQLLKKINKILFPYYQTIAK